MYEDILNNLFKEYYNTFKKTMPIPTVTIMGDNIAERRLINVINKSIKDKKEISKKDITKFIPKGTIA